MQQLIHVVAAVSVAGGVMVGCCGLGETRQGYAALAEEEPSASQQAQVEQEALAVRQAAEVSSANARVATLEQELDGVREERSSLQVKCGQLETALESQSIAAAALKTNSDEELRSRDQVIAQLQESLAEAVAKAACLQRQLENAEGQLAAAAAAKDILQERNGTMKGALGTMEAANRKLAVKAQDLEESLAEEIAKAACLQRQLESAEGQLAAAAAAKDTLQEMKARLEIKIAELQGMVGGAYGACWQETEAGWEVIDAELAELRGQVDHIFALVVQHAGQESEAPTMSQSQVPKLTSRALRAPAASALASTRATSSDGLPTTVLRPSNTSKPKKTIPQLKREPSAARAQQQQQDVVCSQYRG